MPYTTLSQGTAGQVYTAAAHNQIIDNLNALGPAAFNVQTTAKVDTFSASVAAAGQIAVTGLSVNITPSNSSSLVLVTVSMNASNDSGTLTESVGIRIMRDGSPVGIGTAVGNRVGVTNTTAGGDATHGQNFLGATILDNPGTDSQVTYSINILNGTSVTRTLYVNTPSSTADVAHNFRSASHIIAMEIPQ